MTPDSLLYNDANELMHQAVSDLRQRLETGQDYRIETVFEAFPSLASDSNRVVELILLEFQLRRDLGQNPQPSDWYERFPRLRKELQTRLDEALRDRLDGGERETAVFVTRPDANANPLEATETNLDAPVLGRHEIMEEIDRGGMGVVYRAHDLVLDRVVALKMIRSGTFASSEEVQRFYQEARAAAQLRHPNIVPIYGMGLYERQHCFTMALFPRGSLAQHLSDYREDVREAVGLVVKVARAVGTAHEHGIVHRDLKPGNILLGERGEPVVTDFGLAKRMDVSATLTVPTHPVGTPAYMAPEQVRCETATAASDIWSLGIILYELLTGRLPFSGKDMDEVKQKVLHDDPPSPRRLRLDLPRELETIVLTCLEKEPNRRYPSASALADDLKRCLRGEAIHARPEPRWQRLRRRFRRRVGMKGVVLLLIGLMLMSVGGTGVWGIFSYFSPEARERRILEAMERDLAAEKPVTLIGKTGPPKRYRSRISKNAQLVLSMKPDKPFALSDLGICLLELLPDPKRQHYRFSAEVRCGNNQSIDVGFGGRFGIFVQAGERQTSRGPMQSCCVLRYGAISSDEFIQVCCFCGLSPEFTEGWWKVWYGDLRTEPLPPPSPDGWHKLAVEVAPDHFAAYFDDRQVGTFMLWQGNILEGFQRWWTKELGILSPPSPPEFPPQGALGLYVERDDAEFRNVVVEPLADN